jgi:RimJ/RimL family protein N-acetyltransferase
MIHLASSVDAIRGASPRIPAPCLTSRLELRPFCEDDIERIATLLADREVTLFIGGTKPFAAAADSVLYMRDAFAGRGWGTLAVVQRSNNACIGYCGVRPLINTPYVELAFAFERTSWNCGYATEAAKASLDLAFRHLPVDSVVATVYPDNRASIRVLTKAGMYLHGSIFGVWPRSSALLYRLDRTTWRTFVPSLTRSSPFAAGRVAARRTDRVYSTKLR